MSKIWLAVVAVIVIAAGAGWYLTKGPGTPPPAQTASAPTTSTPAASTPAATAPAPAAAPAASAPAAAGSGPTALTGNDRILGKAEAPITIIEYASLTCPHCAEFERETLPKIKAEWIDSGKAKLVFRDFPLDGSALKAAILARCAPADRFYGFIDTLFSSQASWGRQQDPVPALARIAKLGGMSDETFQACLKNDALQNQIVAGRLAAEKELKVESTPTFFINGKKLVGAQPYEEFDKALKAAGS